MERIEINCRICDSPIVFPEDQNTMECSFCHRISERPKSTGKELAALKRGNILIKHREFDEAQKCFEHVLRYYPDEHEALWGKLLAKYGIEIIEEKRNGSYQRTLLCHHPRITSIRNEQDFIAACSYASDAVRQQYEADAAYIDNVQIRIQQMATQKQSYDVFLCYKETNPENGQATWDSTIARRMYNQYTRHEYKVFYAPESLKNEIGESYEAAVYQAIITSKIMIVIGTKEEYFNAAWPKSEWSRYLENRKNNHGLLIPVFSGELTGYDLPSEIKNLGIEGIRLNSEATYDEIESILYKHIREPQKAKEEQEESRRKAEIDLRKAQESLTQSIEALTNQIGTTKTAEPSPFRKTMTWIAKNIESWRIIFFPIFAFLLFEIFLMLPNENVRTTLAAFDKQNFAILRAVYLCFSSSLCGISMLWLSKMSFHVIFRGVATIVSHFVACALGVLLVNNAVWNGTYDVWGCPLGFVLLLLPFLVSGVAAIMTIITKLFLVYVCNVEE